MSTSKLFRGGAMRLVLLAVSLGMGLSVSSATAQNSANKPISRNGLLEALRIGGLSSADLAEHVSSRTVSFVMSAEAEVEFRRAGAKETLIRALWEHDAFQVPEGVAMSPDEIKTLLQSNVPSGRVARFVRARGVGFRATPETARTIQEAGGTVELLGEIMVHFAGEPEAEVEPPKEEKAEEAIVANNEPSPRPDYDAHMNEARKALASGSDLSAVDFIRQAKETDPTRPEAFSLMGFIRLYQHKDTAKARLEYEEALERGGRVRFLVRLVESVGKLTRRADTVFGTLTIARTTVLFRSEDGRTTLEIPDRFVVDSGTSSKFGMGLSRASFSIKEKRGGMKTNHRFQLTREEDKKGEARLILHLMRNY